VLELDAKITKNGQIRTMGKHYIAELLDGGLEELPVLWVHDNAREEVILL
jgi:hypothetical protein